MRGLYVAVCAMRWKYTQNFLNMRATNNLFRGFVVKRAGILKVTS